MSVIHLNQVGYLPDARKRAVVVGDARSFEVVNSEGNVVYSAELIEKNSEFDKLSGDICKIADFSSLNETGKYFIRLDSGENSYAFSIGDGIYHPVRIAAQKMLYYQRCGCALESKYAGKYTHGVCHRYKEAYAWRESRDPDSDEMKTPTDAYAEVYGGWHEAGDFCKQIASGACAVLLLLHSYTMFSDVFGEDTNIPESSNGIPDVLDEARWEIEWFFTMQEKNGGVHYTTFPWRHPPLKFMPEDDETTYYVYKTALESTAMVAQVTALASRIYRKFDKAFADRCFDCAESCWQYLDEHRSDGCCKGKILKNGFNVLMGNCALEPDISHYGAACEMYLTTGDKKYADEMRSLIDSGIDVLNYYQHSLTGFGTQSCLAYDSEFKIDDDLLEKQRKVVLERADAAWRAYCTTAYEIPLDNFYNEQTNQEMLRRAMILILAERIDPKLNYYDAISNALNYFLGQNAVGYCMISGFGDNGVKNYHARVPLSDGIDEPIPGYVVFGPYNLEHMLETQTHRTILQYVPEGTPDMKCYVDRFDYYRINEVEVDTNTYPVYVIAYLENKIRNA